MSIDPNKAALFSQINVGANITSSNKFKRIIFTEQKNEFN